MRAARPGQHGGDAALGRLLDARIECGEDRGVLVRADDRFGPFRGPIGEPPASQDGAFGERIRSAAAWAWDAVMAPVRTMAASTSRARAAAAAGSTRGVKRDGARGMPAMHGACHSVSLRAETPK